MTKNNKFIPTQELIEYTKMNEFAWQMCDSLMEFSKPKGYKFTEEERKEYNVKHNEMLTILTGTKVCTIFDHQTDNHEGFEDLINWSTSNDLLILVDNCLLLCFANKELTKKK